MRSVELLLIAGAGLTHAGTLAAQAASPPPGKLDPSRLSAYHQTFRVIQVTNGAEKQVATVDDALIIHGTEVIRRQSMEDGRGTMVDSSVADRATLKPRLHVSRSPQRTMTLEFAPGMVKGSYVERDSSPRPISETVKEGVFDASVLDLLVSALPLAESYQARLPVFLWEAGGEIAAEFTVTGSAVINKHDAWAVDVTLKGRTAKYHVAKREPRVLQIVSIPAPGMEIRFVQ